MTGTALALVFPLLMVAAGIGDVMTYRIPNILTAATAIAFLPVAAIAGMPLADIGWHALTGLAVLILGFGLFALGWFGGGDAKLMAAAGLWFGWPATGAFLAYAALAGGVLALGVAFWSLFAVNAEIKGWERIRAWTRVKPNLPYGVALAAGTLLALPGTWLAPPLA